MINIKVSIKNSKMTLKKHTINMKNQKGVTFIQILIAIVLLSIMVIPVASVFFTSNRNVEKSGALLDATVIIQSVIDTIKTDRFIFDNKGKTIDFPNEKYPDITIEKGFLEKYKASGKINIEEAKGHNDKDLISLTVMLMWTEEGVARQTSIVTYVANLNDIKYNKLDQ